MTSAAARNFVWGVKNGLLFGTVFAASVGGVMAIRGSDFYAAPHTSFRVILVAALGLGFVGGAVIGLLRPIGMTVWGAIALGAFGGVCAFAAIGVAVLGFSDSISWFVPLGGVTVGARAGLMVWRHNRGSNGPSA